MKRRGFLGKAGAVVGAAVTAGLAPRAAALPEPQIKPQRSPAEPCIEFRREGRSIWGVWNHDGLSEAAIVSAIISFRERSGIAPSFFNIGHADLIGFLAMCGRPRYGIQSDEATATDIKRYVPSLRFVCPHADVTVELSPALPKGVATIEGILPEDFKPTRWSLIADRKG